MVIYSFEGDSYILINVLSKDVFLFFWKIETILRDVILGCNDLLRGKLIGTSHCDFQVLAVMRRIESALTKHQTLQIFRISPLDSSLPSL